MKHSESLNIGILIIGFIRPELLLARITHAHQYSELPIIVVLDGPRDRNDADNELTNECRKIVEKCYKLGMIREFDIAQRNLGCRDRVWSAIDIAFKTFDAAIILEDDCSPSKEFYNFCQNELAKKKCQKEIFAINGSRFHYDDDDQQGEQILSRYCCVWGWATWRDRWEYCEKDLPIDRYFFKNLKRSGLSFVECLYWFRAAHLSKKKIINTWDYSLNANILKNNSKVLVSAVNLIENVGFGDRSTHTGENFSKFQNNVSRAVTYNKTLEYSVKCCTSYNYNFFYNNIYTVRSTKKLFTIVRNFCYYLVHR